jgi:protein involved in ribonucleotide reduction
MSAESARRAFITALGALPLTRSAAGVARRRDAKSLVAYFSRSGNTQVVAGLLHRALHVDLLKIEPATPYPEDYLETVEMAQRERDSGRERPMASVNDWMTRAKA